MKSFTCADIKRKEIGIIMLVKVKLEELTALRELEVETYRETFGPYIAEADLQDYFSTVLSIEQIKKDLLDPESETYFVLNADQIVCGFLKMNWGKAQTEPVEMDQSFEIQRIYVKKEFHGAGFGKEMFEFALDQARNRGFEWAWLGVWERNFKAQDFYYRFGFERFSEHQYITGETVDTDWLLRKKLK